MIDVFDENMYLNKRLHAKKFMKDLSGGDALRELLWHPTFNIAGIWAGYQGPATKTVLPYKANAKLDIRLLPNQDADDIYDKIRAHLDKHGFEDVKLIQRQGGKYAKTDSSTQAAQAAIMAMDNSGLEGGSPWPIFPGHGPAYLFTSEPIGIPFVSYGLGKSGRIHAPDEWFTIEGMIDNEKSCSAYIYYLEKIHNESKNK
jgi:acetylornithine deacetylase/succinyl-diaminopimelate desuccinylase-like protein